VRTKTTREEEEEEEDAGVEAGEYDRRVAYIRASTYAQTSDTVT